MPDSADSPLAQWNAPECPFAVSYLPRVLDDIRLAVVDAFFSLPRGGAEIGGLLLGRHQANRVAITGWQQLDCEHAFGPSFALSDPDRARLAAMIAAAEKNPDSRPVGWYHSHTRSEIFLSEADQELHRHFFPEPWQVALVLRPHTFNPTRGGFFFRGRDGAIRADASCLEFVLDLLPVRPLPSREPAPPAPLLEKLHALSAAAGSVIDVKEADVTEVREEPPAKVPEPAPRPAVQPPPPSFLTAPEPARRTPWLAAAGVLLGIAAGVGAYLTREEWLPPVAAWFHPAGPVAQTSVGLRTLDRDGQLQILWDGGAADVRSGRAGILLITDGRQTRSFPLDAAHLRNGSLTYSRQTERVDVTLSLDQPNGQTLIEAAAFLGKAPRQPAAAGAASVEPSGNNTNVSSHDLQNQRDALAQENAQLKEQVASQAERIKLLEKSLDTERRLLELRSRLQNQATGGK